MRYVAFLRAINVAGHATVTMRNLSATFAKAGCEDVRTVIASGNVLFTLAETDPAPVLRRVGQGLRRLFGEEPVVMYRTLDEIRRMAAASP